MADNPTMQTITQWLASLDAFRLAVGATSENRTELTVFDIYPVTVEARDGRLDVVCDRELPAEVLNAVDMSQLEKGVFSQARSAAMPALGEARQVGGNQWVTFRVPLYLEGLTRNELAMAIWAVWKAQELLALDIFAFKQLEALTSEVGTPPAEEAPSPAAEPTPAPVPQPAAPAAAASRFCPSCGRQAKAQQRFCTGCGASLEG